MKGTVKQPGKIFEVKWRRILEGNGSKTLEGTVKGGRKTIAGIAGTEIGKNRGKN